ncbi:hypothetical protein L9F63_013328, partial [Diploptera punctata]
SEIKVFKFYYNSDIVMYSHLFASSSVNINTIRNDVIDCLQCFFRCQFRHCQNELSFNLTSVIQKFKTFNFTNMFEKHVRHCSTVQWLRERAQVGILRLPSATDEVTCPAYNRCRKYFPLDTGANILSLKRHSGGEKETNMTRLNLKKMDSVRPIAFSNCVRRVYVGYPTIQFYFVTCYCYDLNYSNCNCKYCRVYEGYSALKKYQLQCERALYITRQTKTVISSHL